MDNLKDERRLHPLLWLHRVLNESGRAIAMLTALALVLGMGFALLIAVLFVAMYLSVGLSHLIGGGGWVGLPAFLAIIALIGFYVAPHIQPQVRAAMEILMKPPREGD